MGLRRSWFRLRLELEVLRLLDRAETLWMWLVLVVDLKVDLLSWCLA